MRLQNHLEALASQIIAKTLDVSGTPKALVRPTQDAKHGDYQLNGAMALAKELKRSPRELAVPIAEALLTDSSIASAEVAGPGFINIRLDDAWIAAELKRSLKASDDKAVPQTDDPKKVVVDFSSPNIGQTNACRAFAFDDHRRLDR